ncbi:hypothetical protein N9N28_17575, partial [Rubripirellula amarantea]|nr:hypothetical protein [Rubripirellula amarantea]
MLLDRIDIDAHGPLDCVELGPFSEHLNTVCGPEGSGKTAIVRFIRDSLTDREYPLGMMSSSSGRIVWADRHGMVHCRREKDGTARGRRTIEIESRGHQPLYADAMHETLGSSWIDSLSGNHANSLAARSIQLPESIVDGVITDTSVTSVSRVVSACIRSGLDSPETYRHVQLSSSPDLAQSENGFHDADVLGGYRDASYQSPHARYTDHRALRSELADVEAELARLQNEHGNDYQRLILRRDELTSRLTYRRRHRAEFGGADYQAHSSSHYSTPKDFEYPATEYPGDEYTRAELARLHRETYQLRSRRSELSRWISAIQNDISQAPTGRRGLGSSLRGDATAPHYTDHYDERLRRELDDLDAQAIRWRRALMEVRGLRQAIVDARDVFATSPYASMDRSSYERYSLNGFLHAVDHYRDNAHWDTADWYRYADRPYQQLDEVDARIDSATRLIDSLLSRYSASDAPTHAWYESVASELHFRHPYSDVYPQSDYGRATHGHAGHGHAGHVSLGDTLRTIREDLRQLGMHLPSQRTVSG